MNIISKTATRLMLLAAVALLAGCGESKEKETASTGAPAGAPAPPDAGDPPSDAQVKKDVSGNASGILSVELDKENGKKSWDSNYKQYFWEKWVTVKRDAGLADAPGAKLIVYGFARYEVTAGHYSYREFKVNSNSYEGIKSPSDKEAIDFLKANLNELFPGRSSEIVNADAIEIGMPKKADAAWEWDSPKSVAFNINVKYDSVKGRTQVATKEGTLRAKIFRDEANGPWLRAITLKEDVKETAVKDFTEAQIDAMPRGLVRAGSRNRRN